MSRRHVDLLGFLQDIIIICFKYRGSVTSWIRTDKRNESVGGSPNSLHCVGYACDITFDDKEGREEAIEFGRSMGYDVVPYISHTHFEYDTHIT